MLYLHLRLHKDLMENNGMYNVLLMFTSICVALHKNIRFNHICTAYSCDCYLQSSLRMPSVRVKGHSLDVEVNIKIGVSENMDEFKLQ